MAYRTLEAFRLNGYKLPPHRIVGIQLQLAIIFVVCIMALASMLF